MENLVLIRVESLDGLEPNKNMLVILEPTGQLFRGNDDGTLIQILDNNNPAFYANHFLLMGA